MSGQIHGQSADLHFAPARLRDEMQRTGMNDEQVAVAIDVRVKSVERWRRGNNEPHVNHARRLAMLFHRELDFFYEPNGDKATAA